MSDLVMEKNPKSPISEAYRTIRTNVDFSSIDKEIRKRFLEAVPMVYERIIIDSPPINAVTDAQIISAITEGVLLVVTSEKTDIEDAKRAKELLLKVKANILGVVLRRLKVSKGKYGHSGYCYYYSEDGDKRRSKRKDDRHPLTYPARD